jgi:hypothetical protein
VLSGDGEKCARFAFGGLIEFSLGAACSALRACRDEAGCRTLPDDATLEFRQRAADVKGEAAARRRRIHRFRHGLKYDAFAVEQLDRFDLAWP